VVRKRVILVLAAVLDVDRSVLIGFDENRSVFWFFHFMFHLPVVQSAGRR